MDTSPIALRFKANSRPYLFFQFSLVIYDLMLFDDRYDPGLMQRQLQEGFRLEEYNYLQAKFNLPGDDKNSITELSIIQCIWLLSIVDQICKALLTPATDTFDRSSAHSLLHSIVSAEFTGIGEDWDKSFFISAQYIFDRYKDNFKDLPGFDFIMKLITKT